MPLVAATTSVFTATELASLQSDLDAYLALYAPLFQRSEQVASARRYLQGLLCDEPRKSVERMVLKLWGADGNLVRSLQQFMGESPWSDSPLLARHWQEVGQTLGEEEGVLIVDGSDFRKQGQESVGVGPAVVRGTGQEDQLPGRGLCGLRRQSGCHPGASGSLPAQTVGRGAGLGGASATLPRARGSLVPDQAAAGVEPVAGAGGQREPAGPLGHL
ncbi:MAG: transposase [Caldilineaceae bacterium SB0664_bin_22]|nr:transposase [Caldilineaceae bacterium SB0664_bin_22]